MEKMNGLQFKGCLENGAINLSNHYAEIDALNVFPVPDGDTGTNMSMTFNAGVKDALACSSDKVGDIAKVLSKGLLMGARGNSGVILSQIFRGIYQSLEGKNEISGLELAEAFVNGSRIAYKAVMRPVEGTILTVIRESADYTLAFASGLENVTCQQVINKIVEEADASLERTPELLPVLKEVGVVDSGGCGLLTVLQGMKMYLEGTILQRVSAEEGSSAALSGVESEEFGYCTEFIIQLSPTGMKHFNEDSFRNALERLGDSLVVVQDEDIVKVHVHTLTPGDALNYGQRFGEFVKLKIENMSLQHESIVLQEEAKLPKKKYGIIAVAAGDGLAQQFKDLRCDVVISGGQTMNPSTEDFVAAMQKVNAEHIFILPNNSNIVLAAQQAESIGKDDETEIIVLPTKSIPQGYVACLNFNPELEARDNRENMQAAVDHVITGQVTFAIKDTSFEGLEIKENDFMAIKEKDIVMANPNKLDATKFLIDSIIQPDSELLTLFTGEDASADEISEIEDYVAQRFGDVELEVIEGGQPVYSFIMGVE